MGFINKQYANKFIMQEKCNCRKYYAIKIRTRSAIGMVETRKKQNMLSLNRKRFFSCDSTLEHCQKDILNI
jgi:hypothetical protein